MCRNGAGFATTRADPAPGWVCADVAMQLSNRISAVPLSRRVLIRLGPAAAVLCIAAATLVPASPDASWQPRAVTFCLLCGNDVGLDAFNNVLLYLPFGAAAAAAAWRLPTTTMAAAAMAVAIESVQYAALIGRYPSASDVVFNTTGACVGWILYSRWRAWMLPGVRLARAGALAASAALIAVTAATAALLAPRVPDPPLVVQWVPQRAVVFTGTLHRAVIQGTDVIEGPVAPATEDAIRTGARQRDLTIAADITPATGPIAGFAPIVRLATESVVHLALGQTRDSMAFVPALRSRALGFRTMAIRVPVPPTSSRVRVTGTVEPHRLRIVVVGPFGELTRELPLTAGLGWAFLLPVPVTVGPWHPLATAVWLALLGLPLGYYTRLAVRQLRLHGRPSPGARPHASWWIVPAAALVVALVAVPSAGGLATTTWPEWVAAVCGIALGSIAAAMAERARIVHGAMTDAWTAKPHDTDRLPIRRAR